jgi:hypothetical protein
MARTKKRWYKSRTIWLNSIVASVAVIGTLSQQSIIMDHPEAVAVVAAIQGALNVVLRIATVLPIGGEE